MLRSSVDPQEHHLQKCFSYYGALMFEILEIDFKLNFEHRLYCLIKIVL